MVHSRQTGPTKSKVADIYFEKYLFTGFNMIGIIYLFYILIPELATDK
jgi:hypothetical protein